MSVTSNIISLWVKLLHNLRGGGGGEERGKELSRDETPKCRSVITVDVIAATPPPRSKWFRWQFVPENLQNCSLPPLGSTPVKVPVYKLHFKCGT